MATFEAMADPSLSDTPTTTTSPEEGATALLSTMGALASLRVDDSPVRAELLRALDVLSPAAAQALRDGEDPADVRARLFPHPTDEPTAVTPESLPISRMSPEEAFFFVCIVDALTIGDAYRARCGESMARCLNQAEEGRLVTSEWSGVWWPGDPPHTLRSIGGVYRSLRDSGDASEGLTSVVARDFCDRVRRARSISAVITHQTKRWPPPPFEEVEAAAKFCSLLTRSKARDAVGPKPNAGPWVDLGEIGGWVRLCGPGPQVAAARAHTYITNPNMYVWNAYDFQGNAIGEGDASTWAEMDASVTAKLTGAGWTGL